MNVLFMVVNFDLASFGIDPRISIGNLDFDFSFKFSFYFKEIPLNKNFTC